jgi:hypothetical protein
MGSSQPINISVVADRDATVTLHVAMPGVASGTAHFRIGHFTNSFLTVLFDPVVLRTAHDAQRVGVF